MLSGISESSQAYLIRPISTEEIKATIFSINGDKAPGLDVYSSQFFKNTQSIVGGNVCRTVIFFFQNNYMIPAFNSTTVVLVPKCQNPSCMKEFRPISCCSVIYKCIIKILANRLKKVLTDTISPNQSAFIVGRSITDNVLMAQELIKGYGKSTLSARCAIKIDLQKAFDTLSWDFIFDVLTVMKIPSIFIGWIKGCLIGTRYSISINKGLA